MCCEVEMVKNKDLDLKVSEKELLDYCGVLFAMARSDKSIEKEELQYIFEIIDLAVLSNEGIKVVYKYLEKSPNISPLLKRLSVSPKEFHFTVYMGALDVALLDDVIADKEERLLKLIEKNFGIKHKQVQAMKQFALKAKEIAVRGIDDNYAAEAIKNVASGLGAVGVPLAAVYFSGSVIGLSAAGITSGLAALGLGLGMVPGIGVAILLGSAIFVALSKILDIGSKRKKENLQKECERRTQLIVKNLQEIICSLTLRLKDLQNKTATVEANKKAIKELSNRIEILNQIVAKKKNYQEAFCNE